jgi:hypothetical protein
MGQSKWLLAKKIKIKIGCTPPTNIEVLGLFNNNYFILKNNKKSDRIWEHIIC